MVIRTEHMQIVKIQIHNGDPDIHLDYLKGQVFHVTTQVAYDAILKSGKIWNNRDKKFKLNTSSQESFGRHMGYVCLFDLRNMCPDVIEPVSRYGSYNFLRPLWFKQLRNDCNNWNLAYLILNPLYYDQLIPYEKIHEYPQERGMCRMAIPKIEAWIKDCVPLTLIVKIILVTINRAAPDRKSLGGMLHQIDFEEKASKD